MQKLVRWKIREKKPKEEIKQKTPIESKNSQIKSKTPSGSEDSFELPPPKKKMKSKVPKTTIRSPSRHGAREQPKDDIQQTNIHPSILNQRGSQRETPSIPIKSPMKEKDHKAVQSKTPPKSQSKQERPSTLPSSLGILTEGERKKIALNRPVPTPEHLAKEIKTPRSIGSSSTKKSEFINKPLPKIRSKKPPKTKTKISPPTSKGVEKKKKYKAINKPIPKIIRRKTPEKKKGKPPPTFEDKIPKTRIKTKKP